jgi:hypothetical protein
MAAKALSGGWECHRGNFRALNAALADGDRIPEPAPSAWLSDEPVWTDPLYAAIRPKPGLFERLFGSRRETDASPAGAPSQAA